MIGGTLKPEGSSLGNAYGDPQKKSGLWKNAAIGVAGPLLALLGSKMSDGALNFNEGLAHFGRGFADSRFNIAMDERRRKSRQEDEMIELAHNEMQKMGEIDQDVIGQFPELGQAVQKYQEALSADSPGGTVMTAKEASNIIAMMGTARNVMAKGRDLSQHLQGQRAGAAQAEGARNVQIGDIRQALQTQRTGLEGGMNMGEPLVAGMDGGQMDAQGAEQIYGQNLLDKLARFPVKLSTGQEVPLSGPGAATYDRYKVSNEMKEAARQVALANLKERRAAGVRAERSQEFREETANITEALRMMLNPMGPEPPEGMTDPRELYQWYLEIAKYGRGQMSPPPIGAGGPPPQGGGQGGDCVDVPGVGRVCRSQ